MKTSELTGAQLDWAVAQCKPEGMEFRPGWHGEPLLVDGHDFGNVFVPSTNWAQGGPIIERENITVGVYHDEDGKTIPNSWQAYIGWEPDLLDPMFQVDGPTPLIAAMRCYVASKLGDTVEIPEELT